MQHRVSIGLVVLGLVATTGCSKKTQDSGPAGSDQGSSGGAVVPAGSGEHHDRPDRMGRLKAIRDQLDTNHDGKLSPDELAKATQPFLRFDDPSTVDTDHDGDITVEELGAALRARRGMMHRDRFHGMGSGEGSGSGSGSAAPAAGGSGGATGSGSAHGH